MKKRSLYVFLSVCLFFLIGIIAVRCTQPDQKPETAANDFVGDQTCISCHKKEHDEWRSSDHFRAMEVAHDTTVLGDFNNTTYTADGITTKFLKETVSFLSTHRAMTGTTATMKLNTRLDITPCSNTL